MNSNNWTTVIGVAASILTIIQVIVYMAYLLKICLLINFGKLYYIKVL